MTPQVRSGSVTLSSQLPAPIRIAGLIALTCAVCFAASIGSKGDPSRFLCWPALGIALALAWRGGLVWSLPAVGGAFLFGILSFDQPSLALSGAVATLAGAVPGALALRRLSLWKPADDSLTDTIRFFLVTFLVCAPAFALTAVAVASSTASLTGLPSFPLHAGLWLSSALGTLLLVPALLSLLDAPAAQPDSSGDHRPGFDLPGMALACGVAFLSAMLARTGQPRDATLVLYLYLPIVIWVAIRTNERANALTLLASACIILSTSLVGTPGVADEAWRAIDVGALVIAAVVISHIVQALAADRMAALKRVARLAHEDTTTALLNDRGLLSVFGDLLVSPERPNLGLIGLTISNFESMTDLCGTIPAIQLEQSAATLLLGQPGVRCAARFSAGRYALVIDAETVAQVRSVARDIYANLNAQLFATANGNLRLQVCVGGLQIDRHALIDSEDCLAALTDALTIAASVREPQLFVEPLSQLMIDSRRELQVKIEHIREALHESRLELYAQPVVDPDAPPGMVSYEVLTRLRDRDGSLIQPPEFLKLAIKAQMSVTFDRAVVQRAFGWLASQPRNLARTHKCSINLSGATMSDGAFAEFVREQRLINGIPADRIVFEITESEAIRNPAAASRLVDDLKSQGFCIALDDFGTGLATFEYLKRFPLDYVKIDGSFIRNLTSNTIDEEIVMSTVRVARRLNLRTVAEHVHNESVHTRLREMGVVYLQGDLFGAARPIDSIFDQLAEPEIPEPAVEEQVSDALTSRLI
jgi:EAL domain-containing protein (putative c-di-GMP-specific phosphodiesterase class I)/integral membrane sensor domain MASE1/GGDEF domain-containing protein